MRGKTAGHTAVAVISSTKSSGATGEGLVGCTRIIHQEQCSTAGLPAKPPEGPHNYIPWVVVPSGLNSASPRSSWTLSGGGISIR